MMFKDIYQKRRFWSYVITITVLQLPAIYYQSRDYWLLGLLVALLIEWVMIFITWTDSKNRWWVTRYFDPSKKEI